MKLDLIRINPTAAHLCESQGVEAKMSGSFSPGSADGVFWLPPPPPTIQ